MRHFKKLLTFIFISSFLCALGSFSSCGEKPNLPSYSVSLDYSQGVIHGKLVYKFVNSYNSTFNHLKFNLHANAYSDKAESLPAPSSNLAKAYPSGVSYGGIEITSVRSIDRELDFSTSQNGQILTVETGAIFPNEQMTVDIEFVTTVPKSRLRLGENESGVNLGDCFPVAVVIENGRFVEIPYSPIGDPYYSDVSDYFVSVTVPSSFSVASSGYPEGTEVKGDKTTYSYSLLSGRDFALALSEKYNVLSTSSEGITVYYYTFKENAQNEMDLIINCTKFFEKTFGDYPYDSLSVAESEFAFGGMEYSGLAIVDKDLSSEEFVFATVHEIAHQWWHGGVGNNQYADAYIDEGLAEVATYLYLLNTDERLASDMIFNAKSAYKSFFELSDILSGNLDTSLSRPLSSFKNEYEYANLCYNKSLVMFCEYLNAVGLDKGVAKLSRLYKNNLNKNIGLDQIINELGYGEHFKSFVFGNVLI